MMVAAGISGYVMSELAQRHALGANAGDTALFVSGIAGPVVDELSVLSTVTPQTRARLDALLHDPDFSARYPFLEIWRPDGTISYSNSQGLMGRTFPLPDGARRALGGEVVSALSDLSASEHLTRHLTKPYLEVYTPLRASGTGKIVAIAEIHEDSVPIEETLARLRFQTWIIVIAVGAFILGGLYGIVARAARQIENQQSGLAQKVVELQQALDVNESLKERIRRASEKVSEINERFLRHLGAELHDGPIQLLGFATLNVERLRQRLRSKSAAALLDYQEQVLKEAQAEIRQISKGLLLPDILELDLRSIIERAIKIHEARTGGRVELSFCGSTFALSPAAKLCAFRFLQEALINVYKHSGGHARVSVMVTDTTILRIIVSNHLGCLSQPTQVEEGLGLTAMRERIESLGGTMVLHVGDSELRLTMELDSAER
jgi:signal transduction histidine kinase